MIKLLSTNKDKLMQQISKCRGSVFLHFEDGSCCDLKQDTLARNMLRLLELPRSGICLTVADPNDFAGFFRYMLEVSIN